MIETRDLSCTFQKARFHKTDLQRYRRSVPFSKMEDVMRLSVNLALGKQHLHG